MPSLPLRLRLPILLIVASVSALVATAPTAPAGGKPRAHPVRDAFFPPPPSAEEATPDCVDAEAAGDPKQLRMAHLARLGADRWHAAGHRGRGVKVAVLDSGFRGYRDHLGKALPAQVRASSFRHDANMEARDSQHGILCGEVVHALAPEADLLLATWEPDQSEHFLKAVRWAKQQGARVLTCSVIMPSWSDGEGGGHLHEELSAILGKGDASGDVLFFASAGNTARRHWSGAFKDGGDARHEWQPGQKDNLLRPWGKERVSVEVYWQPGARYRLSVEDLTTGTEVGHSLGHCGATRCSAVVRFNPVAKHRYCVRVQLSKGPGGAFHVVALGGDLQCATANGSIAFPADNPHALAVGAVNAEGERASYSSCGPNSRRPKPDLTAPVPFPSLFREKPFTGTSAAAPQAAAVAALIWARHPTWTANQVREALAKSARDLGPAGHDWETGHGMTALPVERTTVNAGR